MKKLSLYWRTLLIILLLAALMALTGLFPKACDFYTDHIYGYLCDGMSRVTGILPFALGEIIMYTGVIMVLLSVIFLLLLIFLRKKKGYRKFCAGYFKTFLMAGVIVVFLYMPTWFVPFRGTLLGRGGATEHRDYTYQEMRTILEYIVFCENISAEQIEISEDGKVDFPTTEELRPKIAEAMKAISDDFPRLKGYYPPVKTALCSDILDRMGIGGYNYPFTMEPTHNKYMSPLYTPLLDAHELSHHKGYYKENEANFLSEIALSQSDDPFLRLAALNDMYYYVYEDYTTAQSEIIDRMIKNGEVDITLPIETQEEFQKFVNICNEIFGADPQPGKRVVQIFNAAYDIEQQVYEEDSHPIDNIPQADVVINEVADTGWSVQEEVLQDNYYSDVVLLLLEYYDGKLY